jgi:Fe-S cluster biogenesis protein NfuA
LNVDNAQFHGRMQRIEELIAAIQEHGNPVVRALAGEMVRALLDVHRAGLAEVLAQIVRQGEPGQAILNGLVHNDLVSRLLLLHGLHPVDLETRIRQALDQVRPLLRVHGADVQLAQAAQEVVRLRLNGGGEDVHEILEQALLEAAPDVLRIEFAPADAPAASLFSLPLVREN